MVIFQRDKYIKGLSLAGSVMEMGVNYISGDFKEGHKNLGVTIVGEVVNKTLDRMIPGPTPDVVTNKDFITEETIQKLKIGNQMKTKVVEKAIEEKVNKE